MVWNTTPEVKESIDVTIKTPEVNETKEFNGNLTVLELVNKIGVDYNIANLNLYTNGDEVGEDKKDVKIGTLSGIEAISKTVGNSEDSEETKTDEPVEDGEKEETTETPK